MLFEGWLLIQDNIVIKSFYSIFQILVDSIYQLDFSSLKNATNVLIQLLYMLHNTMYCSVA